MYTHKKMRLLEELLPEIQEHKKNSKKIVFTNGCYDILHVGHVDLLARAKALGDILILAINTDNSVRRLGKAPNRPINTYDARAYVLSHLESVDYVIPFDEDTPYEHIQKILPDVLIKGGDWTIENIVGHDIVEAHGGKVYSLPLIDGFSTTNTIAKINKAN